MSNTTSSSKPCPRANSVTKIIGSNGPATSFRSGRPARPSDSDTPSGLRPSAPRMKLSERQPRWPYLLVFNRTADRKMADKKMDDENGDSDFPVGLHLTVVND